MKTCTYVLLFDSKIQSKNRNVSDACHELKVDSAIAEVKNERLTYYFTAAFHAVIPPSMLKTFLKPPFFIRVQALMLRRSVLQ